MKSYLFRLTPAALCLLLCGCLSAQGYPDRSFDLKSEFQMLETYHQPDILIRYAAAPDKKAFRNEVITGRIRAIDLHFAQFVQGLSRENNWANLGLDWTVLALSGAGAVVGNAGTKTTLAALSGGFTGAKGSVDKNLFFNKTMPVILSQMEAKRRTVLVRLRTNLEMEPDSYPLTAALIDLDDYYVAGTIPGAITDLTAQSGKAASEAEAQLNEVLEGKFLDDQAGRVLQAFWTPDGKTVNGKNATEIQKWMDNNGLQNVSIPFLIDSDKFKEQRLKAVVDLKLVPGN